MKFETFKTVVNPPSSWSLGRSRSTAEDAVPLRASRREREEFSSFAIESLAKALVVVTTEHVPDDVTGEELRREVQDLLASLGRQAGQVSEAETGELLRALAQRISSFD